MLQGYLDRSKFRHREEGARMGQTMYDTLLAKGKREGLREGSRETAHEMLLGLLRARFAVVPPEVVARVEQAEPRQAHQWLLRAGVVDRLEDVGIVGSSGE